MTERPARRRAREHLLALSDDDLIDELFSREESKPTRVRCPSRALIPLAPGSEIQTPIAIVILCGLMSSTLLNMIVVPTLYFRDERPATRA